jgi:hypothetical protein
MAERLLADLVLSLHLAFIVFVVAGAFWVLYRPRVAILHLPCALWGAIVELAGWTCPLTPLEIALRRRAGQAGYSGGFLDHYLLPVIYPRGLTRSAQLAAGTFVVVVNLVLYALALRRRRLARSAGVRA